MGFFSNLKSRITGRTCYSVRPRGGQTILSICGDIGAARFTTPHVSILVDAIDGDLVSALAPAFAEAYRKASDHKDEALAEEIQSLRRIICIS